MEKAEETERLLEILEQSLATIMALLDAFDGPVAWGDERMMIAMVHEEKIGTAKIMVASMQETTEAVRLMV